MASKPKTIDIKALTVDNLKDILKIFKQPYGSKDLKDKLTNRVKELYKNASKGSVEKKNILKEITLRLDNLPTRTLSKRVKAKQSITIISVANYLSGKIKGSKIQSDTKDSNSIYINFGKNEQHHVHIYKNVKLVISIRIAFNSFENFELRYDHDSQKLCNAFKFKAPHLHIFRPFPKGDKRRGTRVCLSNSLLSKNKQVQTEHLKDRIKITNEKLGTKNELIIPPQFENKFNKDFTDALKYITKIDKLISDYVNDEKSNHSVQFTNKGGGKGNNETIKLTNGKRKSKTLKINN
jgi:hypothetical protein|tara:strand:- start:3940 stop:4821 length:882 start_codon:yes stop_codon:yes gene_type:complete